MYFKFSDNVTRQECFSAMRGHVMHGQYIRMPNGDTLQIVAGSPGGSVWKIMRDRETVCSANGALEVERYIVEYAAPSRWPAPREIDTAALRAAMNAREIDGIWHKQY